MNTNRLGNFIRQERGNLSRSKFAEKLDISESFLNDLERGRSLPSRKNIFRFAEVLRVDSNLLFDLMREEEAGSTPEGKVERQLLLPADFTPEDLEDVEEFIAFKKFQKATSRRFINRAEADHMVEIIQELLPLKPQGDEEKGGQANIAS